MRRAPATCSVAVPRGGRRDDRVVAARPAQVGDAQVRRFPRRRRSWTGCGSSSTAPSRPTLDTTPRSAPRAESPSSSCERSKPSRPCTFARRGRERGESREVAVDLVGHGAPRRIERDRRRELDSRAPLGVELKAERRVLAVEAAESATWSSLGLPPSMASAWARRSASASCWSAVPFERSVKESDRAATFSNAGRSTIDLGRLLDRRRAREACDVTVHPERDAHLVPRRFARQRGREEGANAPQARRRDLKREIDGVVPLRRVERGLHLRQVDGDPGDTAARRRTGEVHERVVESTFDACGRVDERGTLAPEHAKPRRRGLQLDGIRRVPLEERMRVQLEPIDDHAHRRGA